MLKLLLKNRLQSILSRFSGSDMTRSKKALTAGSMLLIALLGAGLCAGIMLAAARLLQPFCAGLSQAGLEWLFYAMGALLTLMASFLFTMFYAQGAIFEAKDNELLLSMPIPPAAILGSRVLSLLLLNLTVSVPLMGGVGLTRLNAGPVTPTGVVFFVLGALLLPFLGAALSCLLGWAVSMLTRRMRLKSLFQMVFSLAFLLVIYFVSRNINTYMEELVRNSGDIAATMRRALPPFYAFGQAVSGRDGLQLALFAAFCLVPFGLLYLILSRFFVRIVTSRSGARGQVYHEKTLKGSPVVAALARKDLRRFVNSSAYMLNAGLGIVMAVAAGVAVVFGGTRMLLGILGVYAEPEKLASFLPFAGTLLLGFAASQTYLSAPSISVENKSLWILQSMPLTAKQVLRGKLLFHLIPSVPAFLFASLMFLLSFGINDFVIGALMVATPLLMVLFCGELGLAMNLFFHRFNYRNESSAIKNSGASVIAFMGTLAAAFLPLGAFLLPGELSLGMRGVMLFHALFLAAADLGMWLYLNSRAAERRWNRLEYK